MSETRTYTGGCHCGAVRYEVDADIDGVFECNCSICSRKGVLLTFVSADRFRLLQGEGALTDYQFNKRNVHHLFCRTCGVQSFGWGTSRDGSRVNAINVRCLDDVDVASFPITQVDGKNL